MNKKRIFLCMVLTAALLLPVSAETKSKTEIPDFSTTARKDVPVEYTWKIADIYPTMAAWEKAKEETVKKTGKIDGMAEEWISSPQKMLAFLELLGDVRQNAMKLFSYASHQANADLGNPLFQQMKGQLQMIFVRMQSKLAFMNDDILKLGEEKFSEYLKAEPGLAPYAFNIEQTLRMEKHILPTDRQRVASLTGLFSGAMQKASKMLNDVEIPAPEITLPDGKKIVLNHANYIKYRASKNPAERALAMNNYWKNHKKFENTLAILLDSGMKQHLFNARIHKYTDCLEARLFHENIDPQVYHNLIKSTKENLAPLYRYLTLKKEILGFDKYKYEDIYASAVKSVEKLYPWDEAETIILKMMRPLGKDYRRGLEMAFNDRWIDRYGNKGKETGAYSGGLYGVHPFVKMNYNGSYETLSTLAHELGHAMHSHFSNKKQPFAMAQYSAFLAEIASTFNENLLMEHLLKMEKDDLFKLFILDGFINRFRGTVYRQTLFAEFELEMHRQVEKGQTLTSEWLNKKYLEITRLYYGHDKGIVEVGDFIQNEWSGIPHFYLNYYVFTYATGMIASQALTEMVLNGGEAEREKYLDFLKAGGSRYPLDTLKLAGVDMTTTAPAEAAFKRFDRMVSQMEKIVKRLKKQGKL
ncbi:MAG: oligoendopeptidase F [Candidatus Aminicenantes bacterium]|nr:oligoendopeptidase F [Candidatus Aminicenantes bacterium]